MVRWWSCTRQERSRSRRRRRHYGQTNYPSLSQTILLCLTLKLYIAFSRPFMAIRLARKSLNLLYLVFLSHAHHSSVLLVCSLSMNHSSSITATGMVMPHHYWSSYITQPQHSNNDDNHQSPVPTKLNSVKVYPLNHGYHHQIRSLADVDLSDDGEVWLGCKDQDESRDNRQIQVILLSYQNDCRLWIVHSELVVMVILITSV